MAKKHLGKKTPKKGNKPDKNHDENAGLTKGAPQGQILIYQDGGLNLKVRLEGRTVWLSQLLLAELYQTTKQNISQHLKSIFEERELEEDSVVKKFFTTAADGKKYTTKLYNLDAILAVGYRVRSARGTAFRQWATARLSELLIKGFTLDDERLKAGKTLGDDYFDELLERIRDIRSSERLFYQKITDIYATSIDYDSKAEITQTFYATAQNKLHWAIHGRTAAELVKDRADAAKPHMGLTTWKNAPHGPVRRADITVAKNYLDENELRELNRVVSMYLDYAEDQARRHKPMAMADWVTKLDAFLQFNERNILTHAGSISHQLAEEHAQREFEKYETERRRLEATRPTSDFDHAVDAIKKLGKEAALKPKAGSKKKQTKK